MAEVKREGKDVTIVAYSKMLLLALEVAEDLGREGISVEVVDPRTLPAESGLLARDGRTALVPVALVSESPMAFTARPNARVRDLAGLIALAKKNPGKLTFGSSGQGGPLHMYGELFKYMAGIDMLHVPYKANQQALTDLLAGRISVLLNPVLIAGPQAKGGKMRLLGFTSAKRSQLDPNLPTLQESGIANYNVSAWWGAWYPAKTPQPIVDQTAKWLHSLLLYR